MTDTQTPQLRVLGIFAHPDDSEFSCGGTAALARAHRWNAAVVDATAQFEPAFAAALSADRPTLIHVKLDPDISTSRTTLTAIRRVARER